MTEEFVWKTMESAPRQGFILAYVKGYIPRIVFKELNDTEWSLLFRDEVKIVPTMWFPLPENPE